MKRGYGGLTPVSMTPVSTLVSFDPGFPPRFPSVVAPRLDAFLLANVEDDRQRLPELSL